MIILDVNKLSKNFGYGQLFEDVSFSLNEGESISIVGPNGCGKSTLLRIIAGVERADKGVVNIKKDASVAYLDQTSADRVDNRIVFEVIKDVFVEVNELATKIKKYEDIMANPSSQDEYDRALERYCKVMEEFSNKGGYYTDVQINTVCKGLKISETMLYQEYSSLSGGEKTLVQLAKALLQKPQLILLDEPTNHLDIERIEWLEEYIKSFKGASVIVSHDRYFLDKMSTKILDLSGIEPKVYNTNYTGYLEERERDFEKQMAAYADQQLIIKRLQEQIKYFAERGMATNSSTLCNRAHALQSQLDRILAKKIERPQEQKNIKIGFNEERKSSKRVFETKNLIVIAPDGRKILDGIDLTIAAGERIALIGSNGSGKSTFVKTLLGLQSLEHSGDVIIGPGVKVGYLPQIIDFENDNQTLLECFKYETAVHEQRARQILAAFQFYKEDVNKKVKNLSGGERIRLRLASLLQQNVNSLVFDEPTNHIDIPTKEVLEKAIEDFDGTVIFVSHDRYFINKFAEKTIEFDNGKIVVYNGNYEYYKHLKKRLLEESKEQTRVKKNTKTNNTYSGYTIQNDTK